MGYSKELKTDRKSIHCFNPRSTSQNLKKVGLKSTVLKRIRQKNLKKIFENKKRLNFIVLNLVVIVIIVKFKMANYLVLHL